MKKPLSKTGRPVKIPPGIPPIYFMSKLEKVFRSYGIEPDTASLIAVQRVAFERFYPNIIDDQDKIKAAKIKFAELFASKPEAMVELIRKVNALAEKVIHNPQVAYIVHYCNRRRLAMDTVFLDANPELALGIRSEIAELERGKAAEISDKLRAGIKGLNAAAVRNARAQIRNLDFT